MNTTDIPDPVAADAPSPDQFDPGAEVRQPGVKLWDVVAVTHDGEIYCLECANPEYVDLCRDGPREIPYGGPVSRGDETDCPGSTCGNCHRRIASMSVLHYEGVCDPDTCPQEN